MSITCDIFIDMNTADGNPTTVTAPIMANGTQPAGATWTVSPTPATGLVKQAHQFALLDAVIVRGGQTYQPGHTSCVLQLDGSKATTIAQLDLTSLNLTKISVGGWLKTTVPNINPSGNLYDLWQFAGNLSGDLVEVQLNDGTSGTPSGYALSLETTSTSFGTIHSDQLQIAVGDVYWVSFVADYIQGVAAMSLFTTGGVLAGSVTMPCHHNGWHGPLGTDTAGDTIALIRFGNNEAGADGGLLTFEQIVIDYGGAVGPTAVVYPLGPGYLQPAPVVPGNSGRRLDPQQRAA